MSESKTLEQLQAEFQAARECAAARAQRTVEAITEAEERLQSAKARLSENTERLAHHMALTAIGDENWPPERLADFRASIDQDLATVADTELLLTGLRQLKKRDFIGEAPVKPLREKRAMRSARCDWLRGSADP